MSFQDQVNINTGAPAAGVVQSDFNQNIILDRTNEGADPIAFGRGVVTDKDNDTLAYGCRLPTVASDKDNYTFIGVSIVNITEQTQEGTYLPESRFDVMARGKIVVDTIPCVLTATAGATSHGKVYLVISADTSRSGKFIIADDDTQLTTAAGSDTAVELTGVKASYYNSGSETAIISLDRGV